MTREDAIKTLKELWRETNDTWYEEVYEMAINALEADRKTENSSEKPNNCEELNAYRKCVESRSFWDNKHCDGCYFDERCPFDEPKDEPTISKMEQVDKDINVRSKDEPQTCSVSGRPYSECADCEHFRCTADEPQTDWKDQMWAEAVEQSGKE